MEKSIRATSRRTSAKLLVSVNSLTVVFTVELGKKISLTDSAGYLHLAMKLLKADSKTGKSLMVKLKFCSQTENFMKAT